MSSRGSQTVRERRVISEAELERLLALAHGLMKGSTTMTVGDLLTERIRIQHLILPADKSATVILQINESMQRDKDIFAKNTGAVRFAEAVLFPLVGTVTLSLEQLKHLLTLLDCQGLLHLGDDSTEVAAIHGLCHSNSAAMEQLINTGPSNLSRVMAVYRFTSSLVSLERLIGEIEAMLSDKDYTSDAYKERTKEILSTILKYPPERSVLRNALLRLLRTSEPSAKGRDELETVVAETGDVTLLLPLLVEFARDTTHYEDLRQSSRSVDDVVRGISVRQKHLLKQFTSPEATSVRKLYETLRACQTLPLHSDYARLKLRREAVTHASMVIQYAETVLIDFISVFAHSDEGQIDLVYLLCCLPKERAISFLRSAIRRDDLTQIQHATLSLALSYVSSAQLPSAREEQPVVARPANNGRTWLGDENIEGEFHGACARATVHISRIFESSAASHEERLTGMFLVKLQAELHRWARNVEAWAAKQFHKHSNVKCTYEDVAASGPEKVWGADIGFYLRILANGVLASERAFLVQAKKVRLSRDGRELSWTIDRAQRDVLIGQSPWSMFLLYGCHRTGTDVRVAPALLVRDLMIGAGAKSQISASNTIPATRPFADFFTYDFLANWWGDCDGRALDVVRGRVEDFSIRTLFSIDINFGMVG